MPAIFSLPLPIGSQCSINIDVRLQCNEARLYGPLNDVYSDATRANMKKFVDILKPLHTQRPIRE